VTVLLSVQGLTKGYGSRLLFTDVSFDLRVGERIGLIGIPNRYMHSAVEIVCLEDLERSARLLAEFCLNVTLQTDWTP